jgi:hypothetical protein
VRRLVARERGGAAYAHQQGITHIEPENILLSQGEPVAADHGIALAS